MSTLLPEYNIVEPVGHGYDTQGVKVGGTLVWTDTFPLLLPFHLLSVLLGVGHFKHFMQQLLL